jgi:dienelactone hydrolase
MRIFWLGSLLLIASLFQVSIEAKPLSFQHFAKDAEFKQIKLSPNGKYYAALAPKENRTILAIIDRDAFKIVTHVSTRSNEHVTEFYWANDDRIIYKTGRVSDYDDHGGSFHQIYAMNRDGKKHIPIFGFAQDGKQTGTRLNKNRGPIYAWGHILHLLPDDPNHILVRAVFMQNEADSGHTIFKVNIKTTRRKKLTVTPFGNFRMVANNDGTQFYGSGVSPKGEHKSFLYEDDEWTEIKSGHVLDDYHVVAFDSDNNSLFLETHLNGKTNALFKYSLKDNKINMLFHNPEHDFYQLIKSPETGVPIAVKTMSGKAEIHYLDTGKNRFSSYFKMLYDAFPNQDVSINSYSKDLSEMVVLTRSDRNTGEFFLFNPKKKAVNHILTKQSWLDPEAMAEQKPISFKNREGITLHGYLTQPIQEAKEHPLVVLVHGGPFGIRDSWFFDSETQMLANNGFAVLQVNYRGSGGYGLDFKQSTYTDKASMIQDDIIDATKWAAGLKEIDAKNICIMGASFGAYSAVMAPIKEPGLYKCSVAQSGFYDSVLQEEEADYSRIGSSASEARRVYGNDEEVLKKQSPLHYPKQLITPVFIVHGGKDERTPPVHAYKLKETLDKVGTYYEWLFYESEGHGFRNEAHLEAYYTQTVAFLNRYLKQDPKSNDKD